MQASGDTSLLNDIEKQEEQTAKQISRITGTGMRREGLFGGGTPLKHVSQSRQSTFKAFCHELIRGVVAGDESWLKEADLDFFARGPSEGSGPAAPDGSGAVVTVRGGVLGLVRQRPDHTTSCHVCCRNGCCLGWD